MSSDPTDHPGYDPRVDPNSDEYDPYYIPGYGYADDRDDSPMEEDPDDDSEYEYDEDERHCVPVDCEFVEVEDGWCCSICYEECSDGSGITTADCWECSEESE